MWYKPYSLHNTTSSHLAQLLEQCALMLQRTLTLQSIQRGVHGVQARQKTQQCRACAGWGGGEAAERGCGEQGTPQVAEAALDPLDDARAVHHKGLEGVVGSDGGVEAHGEHVVDDIGAETVVAADIKEGVESINVVSE